MNMNLKITSGIFVLAVSFFISTPAYGATQYSPDTETITYLFDHIFAWEDNDSSAPSGDVDPPWLTASFQQMYETENDGNSYDGVKLTLDSEGLPDDTSYVTDWYFNFDPSLDIDDLSIIFNSAESSDSLANISVDKQTDGFALPGAGHPSYDIKVSIQIQNNNDGWFYRNKIGVFDITYDNDPLKYTSFDFLSEPNSNDTDLYLAAAKVQGIDEANNNGWSASIAASGQPIPEPATLLLLGIGIMALSPLLKRFAGNRSRGK